MASARILKLTLLSILFLALILPIFVFGEDLEKSCQEIINNGQQSLSKENYQAKLKECQDFYENQITAMEKDIKKTGVEKATLENKIYTLNKNIKNLNYQIYQSNLVIKDLGIQIKDTEGSITQTSSTIEGARVKLANILRNINEEDQKPMIEVLFSEDDLSSFFDNLMALESLGSRSKDLLQDIKTLKVNLEEQKKSLGEEKGNLEQTVQIQTLQKKENDRTKSEQQQYLNITEQEYQKQRKEKEATEAKATEIRARIFEIIGVPKAPTFGEAYEIAKYIEGITNVRSAFLLAILTQESNIGKNVGQCYLKNPSTGEGVGINTGRTISRVMKPMGLTGRKGDVNDFLRITKNLGRDSYNTPVSCPMSYGWGGAMGPAQFIPTTWALYENKLKEVIGRSADPWNIRDSFMASALYLSDLGASQQTSNAEWKAAMRYFSGTAARTKYNGYGFYGDSVINITAQYENDIKAIE